MGEVLISSESEFETKSWKQRKEKEDKEQQQVVRGGEEEETESWKTEEEEEEEEKNRKKRRKTESAGDGMLMGWDKLFPRMALRVLLVEADDSTRQIVAALLRKCGYKVASVSDGLKAWEILKGRHHNIDLILTEVDLPSISGYALLTLIMEHEICKNIPVIMMSSHDSISTVYKCMLKGAADYLVKPIRRNELRNVWQHVWRRQSSLVGGNGSQDESVGQGKVEATSENSASRKKSSSDMVGTHRSKEQIEKESDSQSSCTKPDLEAESAHAENMHKSMQSVWGNFLLHGMKMQQLEMHENEARVVSACEEATAMTVDTEVEPENQRRDVDICFEAYDNNGIPVNSCREAININAASTNHMTSSTDGKSKVDSSSPWDLSLKRSHPNDFELRVTDERDTLRHSNASAFTRYCNRPLQPLFSTFPGSCYQKEAGADSERKLSSNFSGCNFNPPGPLPSTQRSVISLATNQTKESQISPSCSQQRVLPIQIPVKGVTFNNHCTGYGSSFPPVSCKQSGATPMMSLSPVNQPEPPFRLNSLNQYNFESNSEPLTEGHGQNVNNSGNQSHQKQDHQLNSVEERGHISPTTDQSASNSFCNGPASHYNSMGYGSTCGSNSNSDQAAVVRTAAESNSEGVFMHNTNSHRSIQREVALSKFRMKRKDRCYEKKVRYESRKKLAEQRPRVKGQFVRQVPFTATAAEANQ